MKECVWLINVFLQSVSGCATHSTCSEIDSQLVCRNIEYLQTCVWGRCTDRVSVQLKQPVPFSVDLQDLCSTKWALFVSALCRGSLPGKDQFQTTSNLLLSTYALPLSLCLSLPWCSTYLSVALLLLPWDVGGAMSRSFYSLCGVEAEPYFTRVGVQQVSRGFRRVMVWALLLEHKWKF